MTTREKTVALIVATFVVCGDWAADNGFAWAVIAVTICAGVWLAYGRRTQ